MNSLLEKLLQELENANSPLLARLQNGIDRTQINFLIANFGVEFPNELYDLYAWRNGIQNDENKIWKLGESYLFNLGIFQSLNSSAITYQLGANKVWGQGYFPIFASGSGEFYLLDCRSNSDSYGVVYYHSPSDYMFEGLISIYDSLSSLIQTITECYRTKTYYFESNSYFLQIKDDEERKISFAMNPNAGYWKLFQ